MQTIRIAVAAGFLCAAPTFANAAPRDSDAVSRYYYMPVEICEDARNTAALTLAKKEEICLHAKALLVGKLTDAEAGPQTDYEANFYWHARASLEAQIQGIYREMDAVRSRRVCAQVEAQAAALDKLKPAAWPDEQRSTIDEVRTSVQGPLAQCRTAFPNG